jgi:hypothetical protein
MHLINNTLFVLKKNIILSINSKKKKILADIWHIKIHYSQEYSTRRKIF